MKSGSKKLGIPANGRFEYTNRVKPVTCNCSKCIHSKKAAGTLYCSYYDTFSPKKKVCVRYSPIENDGVRQKPLNKSEITKMSKKKKSFPWEI